MGVLRVDAVVVTTHQQLRSVLLPHEANSLAAIEPACSGISLDHCPLVAQEIVELLVRVLDRHRTPTWAILCHPSIWRHLLAKKWHQQFEIRMIKREKFKPHKPCRLAGLVTVFFSLWAIHWFLVSDDCSGPREKQNICI